MKNISKKNKTKKNSGNFKKSRILEQKFRL